jgi:MFS family permease
MKQKRAPLASFPFYYGWVVIAVAFVTMGIGVNARTSFSLLYPPILAEFGWDRGTTAAAFSVGFVSSTLLSPIVGIFMDRWGPRLVVPLGTVMVALGFVGATIASQPWHLYLTLGVLVVGGSIFVSYIGHSMFLPNWFVKRRGLAIGIAFSGVGVVSIFMFPLLQAYIDFAGWRAACIALAILLVATIVPLNIALQRRRPEDLGLEPDGARSDGKGSGGRAQDNVVDADWVKVDWTLRRAIREPRFWWVFIGYFAALYAWYSVQVHQTKYLVDVGFDAATAAFALAVVGFAGIGGQIGIGWFSDRAGREVAWTLACVGYAICYVTLLMLDEAPSTFVMYVMVISQGLLGYGIASIYGAIPAELFQGRKFATVFGVLTLGGAFGAGGGPWLTGFLYDLQGDYHLAFWLGFAMSVVSAVCIWLAAPRKVRMVGGLVEKRRRAEAEV